MAFAILVDLVGHRFDTPVFLLNQLSAVVCKYCAKMFDKAFGLRVGQILTRDKDMLVKGHVHSTSIKAHFIGGSDPSATHPRETARFIKTAKGRAHIR